MTDPANITEEALLMNMFVEPLFIRDGAYSRRKKILLDYVATILKNILNMVKQAICAGRIHASGKS